ncbi:rhodanese-like domain-containing protein [Gynurincola endophyticus]|uniref:rhodanese-like domain-containing protein n=1 Tax=Gynurincola endophyticus TaxID=2479004 RepID=UPI000F8DFB91|nr:rhodanese-like domain-containing protein [Gynurincola endophyticus]
MNIVLIITVVFLLIYIIYRVYRSATRDQQLAEKVSDDTIILDVRTENEYNSGHIKGSINISLGTLRERCIELDSSKAYVTTCSHGLRSVKAVTILKERGFQQVVNGGAIDELKKTIKTLLQHE